MGLYGLLYHNAGKSISLPLDYCNKDSPAELRRRRRVEEANWITTCHGGDNHEREIAEQYDVYHSQTARAFFTAKGLLNQEKGTQYRRTRQIQANSSSSSAVTSVFSTREPKREIS